MMVSHRVEGHTRCADSPSGPLPWVNPNPIVDRADGPLTGSGSYSLCRPVAASWLSASTVIQIWQSIERRQWLRWTTSWGGSCRPRVQHALQREDVGATQVGGQVAIERLVLIDHERHVRVAKPALEY